MTFNENFAISMKTHIQEKAALLLISDSVAMLFSFVIAILLGHKANFTLGLLYTHRWGFAALFVPTLLLFFVLDGYALHKVRQRFGQQALILGCGLLVSAILSTFLFFFFRDPVPRAVFILFYGIAFTLVVYFRKILNQRMLTSTQWRTLIVGDGIRSLVSGPGYFLLSDASMILIRLRNLIRSCWLSGLWRCVG